MHPQAFISAAPKPFSFLTPSNLRSVPLRTPYSSRPQIFCTSKQPSSSRSIVTAAAAAAAAALILSSTVPVFTLHSTPAFAARGGGDTFFSASGDVIKDPESLLRWALPISNKPIRELQSELEASISDLRGLKWSKVDSHLKAAQRVLNASTAKILAAVPGDRAEEATKLLGNVQERISVVEGAVSEKNPEKLTKLARDTLKNVGKVEEMMVEEFPYQVPSEFSRLPQLKGRATVDISVRKADDEQFDIDGVLMKEGKMTMVLDGYSAPITAGTFLDLVNKGFYDGKEIIRSDGFIVQTGKPNDGEGYEDTNGAMRTIPLEVFARGDKEPTYGITLEEDGRGTASTVLPFTAYGTLAMARAEFEPNTASSQFFWFLFEPDLTPAGRNLMDGSWAVFGYTTDGEKFLRGLQKGDTIVSAKVVEGLENLIH